MHLFSFVLLAGSTLARLETRAPANNDKLADSYDFIIAGGGAAGLVIATRLSEDPNTSVLVIEAGKDGSAVKENTDVPGNAFWLSLLNTEYDWAYETTKQTHLGDRTLTWPRGKVLGGSTAVNGLYLVRPNQIELDTMSSLLEGQDGADNWKWDSLFESMKQTETFTAPSTALSPAHIQFLDASHGTSGPLHYSYPGFLPPLSDSWTPSLASLGIPTNPDPHSGVGTGAFIATSSINPTNWTRSYAKSAYLDPLPPRSNLKILTGNMVTRIILDGQGKATGVEYAASAGAEKKTVNVTKEVIVTGGAIGSPQLLMASGIGPKDVLGDAGVPVKVELPGVGSHLQDHLAASLVYKTKDGVDTAATIHRNDLDKLSDKELQLFLSYVNSAIAYVNTTLLFPDSSSFYSSLSPTPPSSDDPTIQAGYKTIFDATSTLQQTHVGQLELLLALTGTAEAGDHSVAIQVALQHPFSHGRMWIASPDVFTPPVIDPGYLTNDADLTLLREGFKLARKIASADPMKGFLEAEEVTPGPSTQSDEDWNTWIRSVVTTEFHPTGTCAMLPKEKGGVVDAKLKVYGTTNVRVADSSVFPIEFAAHMQAPTYALAERAAGVVKALYNVQPSSTSGILPGPTGSGTGSPGENSGAMARGFSRIGYSFAVIVALLAL